MGVEELGGGVSQSVHLLVEGLLPKEGVLLEPVIDRLQDDSLHCLVEGAEVLKQALCQGKVPLGGCQYLP